MADVAQLGIQVKTTGADKATSELTKLSGAAARAEASTEGLTGANRGAVGAASSAAQAYAKEGAAAASASKQIELMNRAANQNRGAGNRANTANIAAQFQDIAVTAAMSMNPMQIAVQQGTQLVGVLGSMERPLAGLAQAFLSLLSPLSLVTIGLVAAAAAGIQMVDWPKAASAALRFLADNLEAVAPYAVTAAAALALLYSPAIFAGITALSQAILGLTARLAGLAVGFALANPVGAFIAVFGLATAAAVIFRDELTRILGHDIVKYANDGVNKIIGAFVGGYEALKAVWSQLPAALADIVFSTASKVIDGIESMVQSAVDGLNNLINKYALFSSSIGKPLSPETYNSMILGPVEFGRPTNPSPGAAANAMKEAQAAFDNAQGVNYTGKAYEWVGEKASEAAGKIRELADWVGKTDEKAKKKGAGGKTDVERYDDIIDGAKRRISSLQAERDALGLTEQAALKLRYEQDLLNQAQAKGITLTGAQRLEISNLAEQMANLEYGTKAIKDQMEFAKDTTRGFIDDFRAGLESGKGVWESFGDAALGVLDRITDKLLNDVLDAVFKVSGAGSSGGGSFLGNLFGGIFGGGAGKFPTRPGIGLYAAGTPAARPGLAWVGEKGPELVNFKGGEEVIPNHRIMSANQNNQSNRAGGSTASDVRVTADVRAFVDENGNWQAKVENISAGVSRSVVSQYDRDKGNLYQNGEAA